MIIELHIDAKKRLLLKKDDHYFGLPKDSCLSTRSRTFVNDCIGITKRQMVPSELAFEIAYPTESVARFTNSIEVLNKELFKKYGY